jgi:drug/metabolite transporter superfamily protein YnfA
MGSRRVALVGLLFIAIAVFYLAFSATVDPDRVDFAGFTLLIALGAAMSIMAIVLFSGLRDNS